MRKFLKYGIVNVVRDQRTAIAIAVPRNILHSQQMFLRIIGCIKLHCVCYAQCILASWLHIQHYSYRILSYVYCFYRKLKRFLANQLSFAPIKVHHNFLRATLKSVCVLIECFFWIPTLKTWRQQCYFKALSEIFYKQNLLVLQIGHLCKTICASGAPMVAIFFLLLFTQFFHFCF